MAPRQPLNDEQRRLLRITARMPLASVANLASVAGHATEDRVRAMLGRLRSAAAGLSLGAAGHDRTTPAPLLPDQPGGGPALRQRPPAPQPQGGGPRLRDWPPSTPRANCPRTFRERFALDHEHPRPPGSARRNRPPSPPQCQWKTTSDGGFQRATSTRRGPPPRGAWRCPCAGWPSWSRSTAWPPT